MRSLFRHPFPEQEANEPTVSKEECAENGAVEVPEGLIPASDLPSAANALEDLFREDAPPQPVSERPKPTIRELLLEEEEVSTKSAAGEIPKEIGTTPSRITPRSEQPTTALADAGQHSTQGPEKPAAVETAAGATDSEPKDTSVVDLAELIRDDATKEAEDAVKEDNATTEEVPIASSAAETSVEHDSATVVETSPDAEASVEVGTQLGAEASRASTMSSESAAEPLADAERAPETSAAKEAEPVAVAAPLIPVNASDWALEERLACHKEWVESRGMAGSKANFAGAELEGAELIGVNLRYADVQDANLKSADLLLADLRDACLVRTNLQESCLVGANLEGANLEGATLDTAMGLVPRQLAGANLHEASLPEQIAEFAARTEFARTSDLAARFFTTTMAICALSGLLIWMTKDLQLLSDSCIIPFLHSPTAAGALPTAQIYLIAPVVLFIVYCVFHFHLQNLWDSVLQLPGVFPNGRELGQDGPRIVTGLLRAHFRWMNTEAASTRTVERAVALLLAYWVAPLTLLLFWARYLTLQDLHGTMLHLALLVVASGVALYSTTKVGRPQETWPLETKPKLHWLSKVREVNPLKAAAGFGAVLLLLAIGTTKGAPHDKSRAPQFSEASIRRWAPTVFWYLGYEPYANLTEASISTRPANWTGGNDQLSSVKGAKLMNTSFRYAQAYGVFLVNAHLWQSNFQGAFLADADLRGADLGQGTLRYAIMDGARLYHANLDRGNLDGANLDRADFGEANLSHCSLIDAVLIDAQLEGASLYAARLTGASMERANLERTDLRSAYLDSTNLDHADLEQGYFWSAKLSGANLRSAQLASAIFIDADLRDTDLRGAQFSGTVLNGTNLAGANIDGADLRGALGLTPAQVCSTKSRSGAILIDSLATQVQATCGGPLLVAPAAVVPPTSAATTPAALKKTPVSQVSAASQATATAVKNGDGSTQAPIGSKKIQQ